MHWVHINVDGLLITCTVCKRRLDLPDYLDGIYYVPSCATQEQMDQIAEIWGIDPYEDFAVCEDCMQGHCGAVPWATPDQWLAEKWEAHSRSA